MERDLDHLFNRSLRSLKEGARSVGTVATTNSATAVGVMARSGLDHVVVDLQHGEWNERSATHAIRAIALQGKTPIVRVVSNTYSEIGRALDIGALAVVVPLVNNAAEARDAVTAMRYPPLGRRSVSKPLAVHYPPEYWKRANEELMLIVQIESPEAIDNAEEIAAVAGIDAVMAGPTDIWFSTGSPIGSREHNSAMRRILEACRSAGVVPGTFAPTAELAGKWLDDGFLLLTVSTDLEVLAAGMGQMMRTVGGPKLVA